MRAVDRLVAARAPAGASGEERAVIASANEDASGRGLLLEMALQAEILVALHQELLVD